MYAGVPKAAFDAMLASVPWKKHPEGTAASAAVSDALKVIRGDTNFEFAMQATAGILPSAIPSLFESETKPLDRARGKLADAWSVGYPLLRGFVDETMADDSVKGMADARRGALKGHLYLIASYVLGEALTQTSLFASMSAKNAVPYHAKINLGDVHLAAPLMGQMSKDLALEIGDILMRKEWAKPSFWVQKLSLTTMESEEHLVYGVPRDFVLNALTGCKVRTFINQAGKYSPGEKVREHVLPDPAPDNPRGESGVQLEFRRTGQPAGPEDLWESFHHVITCVRETNLPHLRAQATTSRSSSPAASPSSASRCRWPCCRTARCCTPPATARCASPTRNGNTKVVGKLSVYTHDEEGLQGVAVDPGTSPPTASSTCTTRRRCPPRPATRRPPAPPPTSPLEGRQPAVPVHPQHRQHARPGQREGRPRPSATTAACAATSAATSTSTRPATCT
jgi:hypothetical protein